MKNSVTDVNPEMLVWAREKANLTIDDAVRKLDLQDVRGIMAKQRLLNIESGLEQPSRSLLDKMTKHYGHPLITFYLSSPPLTANRGADFRTLTNEPEPEDKNKTDMLLRDVRVRQSMVRSILEDAEEDSPKPFIGSGQISDGKERILEKLKEVLGIDRTQYRDQKSPKEAFDLLRKNAEEAGVFVILKGDLGHYTKTLDVSLFRGFCIADKIAPFIVINNRDTITALSFTLLHELAHLVLGNTAIIGGQIEDKVEKFCNDVASEFLLTDKEVNEIALNLNDEFEVVLNCIRDFAEECKLSRSMVAYRAFKEGVVSQNTYHELLDKMHSHGLEGNTKKSKSGSGGPSYYTLQRRNLGSGLIELIKRMMDDGALSTTRAGKVLGVKPKNVRNLVNIREL